VRITDRPSPDSDIETEIWLPETGWNQRYRGQGNGGFAGFIDYPAMATAMAQGYATAGTDTGHTGGEPAFALGHPEKVKDFGWRAIHDMTLDAKAVVTAFYGSAPAHSYFASCSDGGREALMEAERFPADYDGILAGAPAYNWTGLVSAGAAKMKAMLATPESVLPATKVTAIAAAVKLACDANDGVSDGVINDPRQCGFDPSTMLCKAGDAADCLTSGQVATVRTIYAPLLESKGREVMPGYEPGGEDGGNGWASWITGTPQRESSGLFFGRGFFANFIYERADWKLDSFDLDRDLKLARQKTGAALDATDANLTPFAARGGKLILYHGWNDPAIPALSTVEYFNAAHAAMGTKADDALRLYMVPGMQHCSGGPGATHFGQNATDLSGDADRDAFTALQRWVESGKAPAQLTAQRYASDSAKGDKFSRPLCPYPATAVYKSGDTADAKSFACISPAAK
jgi:feruloyl esterase